jgi:hypothetical protein
MPLDFPASASSNCAVVKMATLTLKHRHDPAPLAPEQATLAAAIADLASWDAAIAALTADHELKEDLVFAIAREVAAIEEKIRIATPRHATRGRMTGMDPIYDAAPPAPPELIEKLAAARPRLDEARKARDAVHAELKDHVARRDWKAETVHKCALTYLEQPLPSHPWRPRLKTFNSAWLTNPLPSDG